jgi:hypothetical protein
LKSVPLILLSPLFWLMVYIRSSRFFEVTKWYGAQHTNSALRQSRNKGRLSHIHAMWEQSWKEMVCGTWSELCMAPKHISNTAMYMSKHASSINRHSCNRKKHLLIS